MEKKIWNFVHYRHKAWKVIFKFNQHILTLCELEHDTLLRQRKLLPPYRKCDPEMDNQRWLATEQKIIQPGAQWWQNLRFPEKEWKSRPTWSKAKQNYWILYQVQVGCKAKYRENRRRVTPSTHIFNFSAIDTGNSYKIWMGMMEIIQSQYSKKHLTEKKHSDIHIMTI